jgi:hypothetical protein
LRPRGHSARADPRSAHLTAPAARAWDLHQKSGNAQWVRVSADAATPDWFSQGRIRAGLGKVGIQLWSRVPAA